MRAARSRSHTRAMPQIQVNGVSLYYEEHILLPTSCFGETRSFVKSIKIIEGGGAPLSIPGETQIPDPDAPAPLPALGAPAQSQQQQ